MTIEEITTRLKKLEGKDVELVRKGRLKFTGELDKYDPLLGAIVLRSWTDSLAAGIDVIKSVNVNKLTIYLK